MRKLLVILVFTLCVSSSYAQTLQWEPARVPYGGSVTGLAKLGGVLFAGTSNFHVFRSDDSGRSWLHLSRALDSLDYYGSLSIGTVWGKSLFVNGSSLFVSRDTGITWQLDTLIDTLPEVIINDSTGYSIGNLHLIRSTDTGRSWSAVSPKTVYVTGQFAAFGNVILLSNSTGKSQYDGIYRSLDDGNAWLRIDSSLPPAGLVAVGVTVFAFTGDSTLFRSTDSGQTWTQVQPGLGDILKSIVSNGQYLFAVMVYNGQVFRSSDDGLSWTISSNGLGGYTINRILALGSEIIAATRNGIYISSDNGDNWGLSDNGIIGWKLDDMETNADTVFATTNSLYRSTDLGETWTQFGKGFIGNGLGFLYLNGLVWFTEDGLRVYRSSDDGFTWDTCAPVPSGPNGEIIVEENDVMIGGGDQFVTSTDLGNSWCCPDTGGGGFGSFVDPHRLGDSLIANLFSGGFGLSTDFGVRWLPRIGPNNLAAHSLIMSGTLMFDGIDNGVYRSFDSGKTWEFVNSEGATMALAATGNAVFAGSNNYGVSLSTDNGVKWKDENKGLPSLNIAKIVIGQSQIYTLLSDGELYRAQFASSNVSGTATLQPKFSTFPNPLSSEAIFYYAIPVAGEVTIALFDPLGREVAIPIESQWQEAGEHEATLDATRLAPGIYECRLTAGGNEDGTKIVVLK